MGFTPFNLKHKYATCKHSVNILYYVHWVRVSLVSYFIIGKYVSINFIETIFHQRDQ